MHPNKYLTFTLFILMGSLCMSCMRTVGIYNWVGNKTSPDFYQIKLNNDYTYAYYGWSDIMGADTVEGTWKVSKDTLYLNQKKKKKGRFIVSIDKKRSANNTSRVSILDVSDSTYVLGSKVYLNGDSGQFVDSSGMVYKKEEIEKIKIEYLSYLDSILVRDKGGNYFNIYLNFKANELDRFYVNPTWLKRGSRLIQVGTDGNKIKGGVYRRTDRN